MSANFITNKFQINSFYTIKELIYNLRSVSKIITDLRPVESANFCIICKLYIEGQDYASIRRAFSTEELNGLEVELLGTKDIYLIQLKIRKEVVFLKKSGSLFKCVPESEVFKRDVGV